MPTWTLRDRCAKLHICPTHATMTRNQSPPGSICFPPREQSRVYSKFEYSSNSEHRTLVTPELADTFAASYLSWCGVPQQFTLRNIGGDTVMYFKHAVPACMRCRKWPIGNHRDFNLECHGPSLARVYALAPSRGKTNLG
jgi:hypothetical protein